MRKPRSWSKGAPEPYPWPDVRDRRNQKWTSCPAGWHPDRPGEDGDMCVGWAWLTYQHGPITEELPGPDDYRSVDPTTEGDQSISDSSNQ
jgi:hypothetical protein